ncbi:MAG TPA: DNA translocase FtsK 4TM domain-containing protein, partial [Mariprofundaceae bacterium]|nr:DNA translocase FtsK 4TM domain-containing protein [Mariprofundaceae bacterium]
MRFGSALLREAAAFVLAGLTVICGLALYSFSPHDPSFNHATSSPAKNLVGIAGAYLSDFFYQLLGYGVWLLLLLMVALTIRVAAGMRPWFGQWTSLFWLPVLLGVSALIDAHQTWLSGVWQALPAGAGGALGGMLSDGLARPFHDVGRDILLVVLTLSSFVAASHISLLLLGKRMAAGLSWCSALVVDWTGRVGRSLAGRKERMQAVEQRRKAKKERVKRTPKSQPEVAKPVKTVRSKRAQEEQQVELALNEPNRGGFKLPGLNLFSAERKRGQSISDETLQVMARMLEKKLLDYRVEGEVVAVQPGPVVTQFEFEPAPGTKVNRIVSLQEDLARSMSAVSVRVAGNIPGKNVIGIEIPNQDRETVYMYDVLASREFSEGRRILPLALGVDISGTPVVADLAKMPHLLVAGTTGSGKSVSVNGMICSMLMTYSPKDLRLIMVDPKMLELSMYDDIPHL